jgi:hypothetical protein
VFSVRTMQSETTVIWNLVPIYYLYTVQSKARRRRDCLASTKKDYGMVTANWRHKKCPLFNLHSMSPATPRRHGSMGHTTSRLDVDNVIDVTALATDVLLVAWHNLSSEWEATPMTLRVTLCVTLPDGRRLCVHVRDKESSLILWYLSFERCAVSR